MCVSISGKIFNIWLSSTRLSFRKRLTENFDFLEAVNLSIIYYQFSVEDPAYEEIQCCIEG